ncbi:MAG: ABC transporter permease [Blastocatellia bacterium]|nr:ABC transporter permease [Blastocatellia bacterium]
MPGLLTIAHLTFHEARRRKILLAALVLGSAFLLIFALGFYFVYSKMQASPSRIQTQIQIGLNFVIMAGLYAVNFLIVMTAVLMPVDTLAGEIGSGVVQTLVTKPIRRWEIVAGKWLGYVGILALYVTMMAGGVLLIARLFSGFTPPNVLKGVPLMFLEGTLLMTISIAGGTRLSTLANGVMGFGLYGMAFIGGWMEQIGTIFGNTVTRNIGIVTSLLVPSESLWQLAAYNMQPPLMRDINLTPFSPASVPSEKMVYWAIGYILVTFLFAVWQFRKRDL